MWFDGGAEIAEDIKSRSGPSIYPSSDSFFAVGDTLYFAPSDRTSGGMELVSARVIQPPGIMQCFRATDVRLTPIAQIIEQGVAFHRAGRLHDAEFLYRRALAIDANCADGWHLLGMIADSAGRDDEAIQYIKHALLLAPGRADILNNLGTTHEQRGEFESAERCLREAIRLQSEYAIAHNNLGEVMKDFGRVGDALSCYRKALEYAPEFHQAGSNLLMGLNYDPTADRGAIFKEHRQWGQWLERRFIRASPPQNSRDPEKRLRLGYVSPDLRKHAVARFFDPILAAHDHERFEVFLYSEAPIVDEVSRRFQSHATGWRPTRNRSTAEVAEVVRANQIDILVDLAGHTRNNRLDVFALKPAPVQVTYLGYPNTTGLSTIDYRLSDTVLDPPVEPSWATEQLVRLPGHAYCFQPPASAPDVAPPPSVAKGYVTFGSHHPPIKLNDRVLELWRQVLEAVPNSRMQFFRNSFNGSLRNELRTRFEFCRLPLDRIDFSCPSAEETSYLPIFNQIDLVLDCFPFTGHTMTCESLWMGVPVLTLRGDRPSGRLSASVLETLGHPDLIARTSEEYVALAQRWAAAVDKRTVFRQQIRNLMRTKICDGHGFTRRLEGAYRWMWRRWCDMLADQKRDDING